MIKTKIGIVVHYFDKLQVAVVKLSNSDLKIGDKVILLDKDGKEFTQNVDSMQIEHAQIDIAKAGDEFGLKTDKKVKDKTGVIKIS